MKSTRTKLKRQTKLIKSKVLAKVPVLVRTDNLGEKGETSREKVSSHKTCWLGGTKGFQEITILAREENLSIEIGILVVEESMSQSSSLLKIDGHMRISSLRENLATKRRVLAKSNSIFAEKADVLTTP